MQFKWLYYNLCNQYLFSFTYYIKLNDSKVKVQQSLYRLGQTLTGPGEWGSQISKQLSHEDGKVVSLIQWLLNLMIVNSEKQVSVTCIHFLRVSVDSIKTPALPMAFKASMTSCCLAWSEDWQPDSRKPSNFLMISCTWSMSWQFLFCWQ